MKTEIKALISSIKTRGMSLLNDARYWDLRRTYGDYSREVRNYLRTI